MNLNKHLSNEEVNSILGDWRLRYFKLMKISKSSKESIKKLKATNLAIELYNRIVILEIQYNRI